MCPKCKSPNPDDAVYCENCGFEFPRAGAGAPAGGGKRSTQVESSASATPLGATPSGGEFWRPAGAAAPPPLPPPAHGKRSTMVEAGEPAPVAAPADPFRRDPFAASASPAGAAAPVSVAPAAGAPAKKAATQYGASTAPTNTADPFAATVSASAAAAPRADRRLIGFLITFNGAPDGLYFALREGKNTLGRDDSRDIRLVDDGRVSGVHACIQHRSGKTWIYDENSVNGTFHNEEDILQEKPSLKDGDVVRVGNTKFLVKLIEPDRFAALWGDGKAS